MYAGPRSSAGGREVERSETRMQGRVSFAYFSLHGQRKVRRPRGRNTKYQRIRWGAEHLCNSRVLMGIALLNPSYGARNISLRNAMPNTKSTLSPGPSPVNGRGERSAPSAPQFPNRHIPRIPRRHLRLQQLGGGQRIGQRMVRLVHR